MRDSNDLYKVQLLCFVLRESSNIGTLFGDRVLLSTMNHVYPAGVYGAFQFVS